LALAEDNAGNNMDARMAITAITTSNSTKVNPFLQATCGLIGLTLQTLLKRRHLLPEGKEALLSPAFPIVLHALPDLRLVLVQSPPAQSLSDFERGFKKHGSISGCNLSSRNSSTSRSKTIVFLNVINRLLTGSS
jgi:hypothetical protein